MVPDTISPPFWKPKSPWQVIRVIWLIACVLTLFLTLIYRGPKYPDAVEAETLIMMGLSFPAGWLVGYTCFGTLIGGSKTTELQWIFITWTPLFCVGYLQWFAIGTMVIRRIRPSLIGGAKQP